MIEIANDGPAITRTSYWRTAHARKGLLYLSVNAGAIRVLVPAPTERMLRGLPPIGRPVTLGRATWQGRATYILQWDEPAESGLEPYSIDIDHAQCDRAIDTETGMDAGRIVPLIWYAPTGIWAVREARREQVQIGEAVAS
jgi:hypothetical protein